MARDIGGVHEILYNLNILPLKVKSACRKICIDDTKYSAHILTIRLIIYPSNNTKTFITNLMSTNSMVSLPVEFITYDSLCRGSISPKYLKYRMNYFWSLTVSALFSCQIS